MSAPIIVNVRNFDVNKLSFTVGPKKPNRMPAINMKYDGQPFNIRFPAKMSVRMLEKTDEKTGKTSYSLLSNMKGCCDNWARERATGTTDMDALYNLIIFDLKNKIINTATEKTKEWFKTNRSKEVITESFKAMFRLSGDKVDDEYVPNGKYAPSMTIKIPVYDDKVSTDFLDEEGNPIKYVTPQTLGNIFENNVEVNMVVSPSIYVMAGSSPGTGGAFGVTWRLNYAKVYKRGRLNAASVFADDEEETTNSNTNVVADEQEEESVRPPTPEQPAQSNVNVPSAPARKKRSAAL